MGHYRRISYRTAVYMNECSAKVFPDEEKTYEGEYCTTKENVHVLSTGDEKLINWKEFKSQEG